MLIKNNFLSFLPCVLDLISTKLRWYGGNEKKKMFKKNIIPGQKINVKKKSFFFSFFLFNLHLKRSKRLERVVFPEQWSFGKNTSINFSINFCHPVNKMKLTFFMQIFFCCGDGTRKKINKKEKKCYSHTLFCDSIFFSASPPHFQILCMCTFFAPVTVST